MELVALRIKIGRKVGEHGMQNSYPDFNSLPESVRDNMDWSYFIDQYTQWHYDKISGFGEGDLYNPDMAVQFGAFCVPKPFATAALAAFPDTVKQLSETDFQIFYDSRAHEGELEILYDAEVLTGLRARYDTIPVAEKQIIEFFTDTIEAEVNVRVAEFEVVVGKSLSAKELAIAHKLAEMAPGDCKSINPEHPAPGICRNKNRFYADFKARKGFTIAAIK